MMQKHQEVVIEIIVTNPAHRNLITKGTCYEPHQIFPKEGKIIFKLNNALSDDLLEKLAEIKKTCDFTAECRE